MRRVEKRRCKPGDRHHLCERPPKALRLSLTAPSTSANHQALAWHLMQPKGMEDLAAFSAKEAKRVAEERERDKYSSAEGQ